MGELWSSDATTALREARALGTPEKWTKIAGPWVKYSARSSPTEIWGLQLHVGPRITLVAASTEERVRELLGTRVGWEPTEVTYLLRTPELLSVLEGATRVETVLCATCEVEIEVRDGAVIAHDRAKKQGEKGRGKVPCEGSGQMQMSAPTPTPAPLRDPNVDPRPHDVLRADDGSLLVVTGWAPEKSTVYFTKLEADKKPWPRDIVLGAWRAGAPMEVVQVAADATKKNGGPCWEPPPGGFNYSLPPRARDGKGWLRAPDDHYPAGHRLADLEAREAANAPKPRVPMEEPDLTGMIHEEPTEIECDSTPSSCSSSSALPSPAPSPGPAPAADAPRAEAPTASPSTSTEAPATSSGSPDPSSPEAVSPTTRGPGRRRTLAEVCREVSSTAAVAGVLLHVATATYDELLEAQEVEQKRKGKARRPELLAAIDARLNVLAIASTGTAATETIDPITNLPEHVIEGVMDMFRDPLPESSTPPSEVEAPVSPASGRLAVPLADVVLDPALQCREAMVPEVVEDYAALLRAGTELPPGRAVRIEGRVYLVDGWHRHAAHIRAERTEIVLDVTEGGRRDALLGAARANCDHGLRRTVAGKRRAVRLLLRDPEWAALSGRELAQLAGVSHTFVDETRKSYGLRRGQVLTDEAIGRVDGEPTGAWVPLLAETPEYHRPRVEAFRVAGDLNAVLRADCYGDEARAARALRLSELATEPWPWPEDMTEEEVHARAAILDSEADLRRAILSRDLPAELRPQLCEVLAAAQAVPRQTSSWTLEAVGRTLEGRPALVSAAAARLEEIKAANAAKPPDDFERSRQIKALTDPDEQAAAFLGADPTNAYLAAADMLPAARDGAIREALSDGAVCPDPDCGGWLYPENTYKQRICTRCHQELRRVLDEQRKALALAARLLRHPGYGVLVDGVLVDAPALRALRAVPLVPGLVMLGGDAGMALRGLIGRPRPAMVGTWPVPAAPAAEGEQEIDEDDVEPDDAGDGEE